MLKLTIQCDRCNKALELELYYKNKSENIDDMLVANNYSYIYVVDTNRLTCRVCKEKYLTLQDKIKKETIDECCEFFETTTEAVGKQIKERGIK